jgi:hypothetical protein
MSVEKASSFLMLAPARLQPHNFSYRTMPFSFWNIYLLHIAGPSLVNFVALIMYFLLASG